MQRRAADCSAEHMRARWFRGHPVLVAVVSPAAMGAVSALLCVPMSATTILVNVVSCVVSPLIADRVVLDRHRRLSSRRWLLMD